MGRTAVKYCQDVQVARALSDRRRVPIVVLVAAPDDTSGEEILVESTVVAGGAAVALRVAPESADHTAITAVYNQFTSICPRAIVIPPKWLPPVTLSKDNFTAANLRQTVMAVNRFTAAEAESLVMAANQAMEAERQQWADEEKALSKAKAAAPATAAGQRTGGSAPAAADGAIVARVTMPDNTTKVVDLAPTDTLMEAKLKIADGNATRAKTYLVTQVSPTNMFGTADNEKTLAELGIAGRVTFRVRSITPSSQPPAKVVRTEPQATAKPPPVRHVDPMAAVSAPAQPAPAKAAAPAAAEVDESKKRERTPPDPTKKVNIKVLFPQGASDVFTFTCGDKIADLRAAIVASPNAPTAFTLAQQYPHKAFSMEEEETTFAEAGIDGSAVFRVKSTQVEGSSGGSATASPAASGGGGGYLRGFGGNLIGKLMPWGSGATAQTSETGAQSTQKSPPARGGGGGGYRSMDQIRREQEEAEKEEAKKGSNKYFGGDSTAFQDRPDDKK